MTDYEVNKIFKFNDERMMKFGGHCINKYTNRIYMLVTDTKEQERIDRHVEAF